MFKVFFHFTELETRSHLPPEEMEIDEEDEFDVFAFSAFLGKIGVRSANPFVRHGKSVLLSCISDEKGKLIFYNVHNL